MLGNDYNTIDGTGVRDYIHVVDLAKGHVKALENLNETDGINVYNLGTGKRYSVLELVKAFEEVNNIKIPYKIIIRRPGDVAECYANPNKAKKHLEWVTEMDIEDMVRDAWNLEKNLKNN